MVTISEIAKRIGVDTTTVRRLIAKESEALGLALQRGKGDRLLLSAADAESLVASWEARRGPIVSSGDVAETAKYDRYGYFYIIQLVPEALPNRVKIGFADNVEKRLTEHQTAAPTAKLLKSWPCKRSWDYAAMDSITRSGCKLVLNEVFEGEIQGFLERGDAFFAVMPSPDTEKELSEHSPLYVADSRADELAAQRDDQADGNRGTIKA
jgi:T5orf172 domain-containing protein